MQTKQTAQAPTPTASPPPKPTTVSQRILKQSNCPGLAASRPQAEHHASLLSPGITVSKTPPELGTMLHNALIRTHHITSRKKVSALKRAADTYNCFVLLRSGGCPGIMYVEAREKDAVESWVNTVRNLRYKDFQLVVRPDVIQHENRSEEDNSSRQQNRRRDGDSHEGKRASGIGLSEVDSVKEFGNAMQQRGVWHWWRKGMGYT